MAHLPLFVSPFFETLDDGFANIIRLPITGIHYNVVIIEIGIVYIIVFFESL